MELKTIDNELIDKFNELLRVVHPKLAKHVTLAKDNLFSQNVIYHTELKNCDIKRVVWNPLKSILPVEISSFSHTESTIEDITNEKLSKVVRQLQIEKEKQGEVTNFSELKVGSFYKLLEPISLFKVAKIAEGSVIYVKEVGYNWLNHSQILLIEGIVEKYKSSAQFNGDWYTYPPTSEPTCIYFDPYSTDHSKVKRYQNVPEKYRKILNDYLTGMNYGKN